MNITKQAFIRDFKLNALYNLAHMGLMPSEMGKVIKTAKANAMTKQALWPELAAAAGGIKDLGKNTWEAGGAALDAGKVVGALALALSGGLGVAAGYGANRLLGPDSADVTNAQQQAVIDRYIAATQRQKAENEANKMEQLGGKKKRRTPSLPVPGSAGV